MYTHPHTDLYAHARTHTQYSTRTCTHHTHTHTHTHAHTRTHTQLYTSPLLFPHTHTHTHTYMDTQDFTFAPGSLEKFRLRGPKLGDLTKLTVEHNGLKREEAWFLEHVTVTEMGEGGGGGGGKRKWYFPCKQWLSLHHSDCQVSSLIDAFLLVEPRLLETTLWLI